MDQLLRFTHDCIHALHQRQHTMSAFIDIKQAYDSVWRDLLLTKLHASGVQSCMFAWFCSFLEKRFCYTSFEGKCSHNELLEWGIPQGAVSSPVLFLLFINDLATALATLTQRYGVQLALFADDIAIWVSHCNLSTSAMHAQEALIEIEDWCRDNLLAPNPSKTQTCLFSLAHEETLEWANLTLHFAGSELPLHPSAKYLGITFDRKFSWQPHLDNISSRATQRLSVLHRFAFAHGNSGMPLSALRRLYIGSIRPLLEYGSEAWAPSLTSGRVQQLAKIQNKALRLITSAPLSTLIAAMEIQTGILPLDLRFCQSASILHEKIARMPDSHPMKLHLSNMAPTPADGQPCLLSKPALADYTSANGHLPQLPRAPTPSLSTSPLSLSPTYATVSFEPHDSISEWYPQDLWIHTYTDGAKALEKNVAGIGYYISFPPLQPVYCSEPAPPHPWPSLILNLQRLEMPSSTYTDITHPTRTLPSSAIRRQLFTQSAMDYPSVSHLLFSWPLPWFLSPPSILPTLTALLPSNGFVAIRVYLVMTSLTLLPSLPFLLHSHSLLPPYNNLQLDISLKPLSVQNGYAVGPQDGRLAPSMPIESLTFHLTLYITSYANPSQSSSVYAVNASPLLLTSSASTKLIIHIVPVVRLKLSATSFSAAPYMPLKELLPGVTAQLPTNNAFLDPEQSLWTPSGTFDT